MAAVWKVIKPSRLKDDAMRLALLNGMRKVGTQIKQDFEKTTQTWDHKPKFETLVSLSGGPTVLVETNDEIYHYVSEGTKPHTIRPTRARVLAFPGVYNAKTTPGVLEARSGGSSGDMVYTKEVRHPGTQPRKFDELIAKKWQSKFKREMESVMKEVAQASGHRR